METTKYFIEIDQDDFSMFLNLFVHKEVKTSLMNLLNFTGKIASQVLQKELEKEQRHLEYTVKEKARCMEKIIISQNVIDSYKFNLNQVDIDNIDLSEFIA